MVNVNNGLVLPLTILNNIFDIQLLIPGNDENKEKRGTVH